MTFWLPDSSPIFDDQQNVGGKYFNATTSNPPMNTIMFDVYRQGVELRTTKDFYSSLQPKLWGGNFEATGTISHKQNIHTYGQSVDYTEFFGSTTFKDLPKFNPLSYMTLGADYPFPIYFNNGPQEEQEAIIEPLTIPNRFPTTELFPFRSFRANIEDGNSLDGFLNGNSVISQFINTEQPNSVRPFLDQGEMFIGDSQTEFIKIEGWISSEVRKEFPYKEENSNNLFNTLDINDSELLTAILSLSSSNAESLIKNPRLKSTAAGSVVYGAYNNLGTDSIAFIGTIRGS